MAPSQPTGPHADVADRFAYLLETAELDREAFVSAVDGAVSARSLYAILSGHRRPSRALAVLIERTWGYRADFLLEGDGPAWTSEDTRTAGPSTVGNELVEALAAYVGSGVDQARRLREALEEARLWDRLWRRTLRVLDGLEHLANEDVAAYAEATVGVLEECERLGERFGTFTGLRHEQRVVLLVEQYVRRFFVAVPQGLVDEARLDEHQVEQLRAEVDELLAALRDRRAALVRRADEVATTLEDVAEQPPAPRSGDAPLLRAVRRLRTTHVASPA